MTERYITIGDVHGCYREMLALLDKVNWDPTGDVLIFAGDMVDRGPMSAEVVQWIRKENEKNPDRVKAIMGNHDDKHYRYYRHTLKRRQHPNYKIPMRPFNMDKIRVFNSLTDEDLDWIGSLPAWLPLRAGWMTVHAGLEPYKSLADQDWHKVSHIRFLDPVTHKTVSLDDDYHPPPGSVFWTDIYSLSYSVVYGHNVHSLSDPCVTVKENGAQLVGIDTGACFGGKLTAFLVPETKEEKVGPEHFVQVTADRIYSRTLVKD